jgi:hypothetical protein
VQQAEKLEYLQQSGPCRGQWYPILNWLADFVKIFDYMVRFDSCKAL